MQSVPVVLSPRATETLQSGGLGGGLLPKANSVHPLSLQAVSPCFSASCAPLTPFSQRYTDNISMAAKN